MKGLFADTFYFLALFNSKDAAHRRAVEASRDLRANLVTTDWVLTELADALCDPRNRQGCAALINDIRRSTQIEIVSASRTGLEAGWEIYIGRSDKSWSLTDCISFSVMQRRQLTEALTGDQHFEQAGFRALLR